MLMFDMITVVDHIIALYDELLYLGQRLYT